MHKEFWIERWEQKQTGFHQSEINSYLQTYWHQMDIKESANILVPLCGKSKDLLWLIEQKYNVTGSEISQIAVADFFEENNIAFQKKKIDSGEEYFNDNLTIIQGDFFQLTRTEIPLIDAVYDRAALVALTPEQRLQYSQLLNKLLPAGSKIFLISFEYDQTKMDGPPFSVDEKEIRDLYESHFSITSVHQFNENVNIGKFANRGLKYVSEKVYILQKQAT